MYNPKITLLYNFITIDTIDTAVSQNNIIDLSEMLTSLAKENIIFTPKAIKALINSSTDFIYRIEDELKATKGIKFRRSFGSGRDVCLTRTEALEQLEHYFITYGLEYIDDELLQEKSSKFKEFESNSRIKVIDYKTISEYIDFISNIVNSSIVFSETEKMILEDSKELLPKIIEHITEMKVKENMLFLISICHEARKFLKTSTDLLRYIYYINDYDYNNLKAINSADFEVKLKTSQKRFIMEFLNSKSNISLELEDLKRYKAYWIRVSNNLKPMSKKYKKYTNTQNLFRTLKNDKIRTFFSFYDTLSVVEKAKHLSKRPGEFIRRIDSLIRNSEKEDILIIADIISNTEFSTKLLIQIIPYLKFRSEKNCYKRIFNVKGKLKEINNKPLEKLDKLSANIIIDAFSSKLYNQLSSKKPFNKNFILSPELKSYIVPTEIRDLSIVNNIRYTPGTRIKFNCKYLRVFTAWGTKNKSDRFDIDLGCNFVDKDGRFESIAYFNQSEGYAQHSGDFTSCIEYKPGNDKITAEFIDIDIAEAKKEFDYAVFSTLIFDSFELTPDFSTCVYVYSGLMERSERSTKDININDSLFKMTLSGDFRSHISFAIDLKTSEIVFIDKYSKSQSGANVSNTSNTMDLYKREYFNAKEYKNNMYDILDSVINPDLEENEEPLLIDNQYVSDNMDTILDLLN